VKGAKKMTKKEVKRTIHAAFPGNHNIELREQLYTAVDDDRSLALVCRNMNIGENCKICNAAVALIVSTQNELLG
jgi:hypothetical protein